MNKLRKADGTIVEVNDNSLEHALSLGWTIVEKPKSTPKNNGKTTKRA